MAVEAIGVHNQLYKRLAVESRVEIDGADLFKLQVNQHIDILSADP